MVSMAVGMLMGMAMFVAVFMSAAAGALSVVGVLVRMFMELADVRGCVNVRSREEHCPSWECS